MRFNILATTTIGAFYLSTTLTSALPTRSKTGFLIANLDSSEEIGTTMWDTLAETRDGSSTVEAIDKRNTLCRTGVTCGLDGDVGAY